LSNSLQEFEEFLESIELGESGIKRWCAVAVLLLLIQLSGGCFSSSGRSSRAENINADGNLPAEVRGWLDRVEGKPQVGSRINVVGWAAPERPETRIEAVEVLLDGIEIAEAAEGVERLDVADSFGKPDWSKSGWETEVSLDNILPREHRIEAVARDSRGARHSLRGGRLIMVLDLR